MCAQNEDVQLAMLPPPPWFFLKKYSLADAALPNSYVYMCVGRLGLLAILLFRKTFHVYLGTLC